MPGAVLGSYEIVSLLGAGGMGEVYRARDQRLGRDVAPTMLFDGQYPLRRGARRPAADGQDGFAGRRRCRRQFIVVQNWFEELRRLVPLK